MLVDFLNDAADQHEADGGTCKTITIGQAEYRCCLDINGDIKSPLLKVFAQLTNQ